METDKIKHPGVAAVLSFVFNGLGQLYNGQIIKGLVIISLSAISMFIFILGSIFIGFWLLGKVMFGNELLLGLALFCMGLIAICVIGIYSIFDAYKVALRK